MDSDVLKRKDDYRRILGDFRSGKIDVLVGTQMIAKGLHFPNVTLVGIVYADLSLHQSDFRAGERTFQLLTQVADALAAGTVKAEFSCRPSHRFILPSSTRGATITPDSTSRKSIFANSSVIRRHRV